jgi:hypothetical protein
MRTASAYISKMNAEALGRNSKVQDTNHRLYTTNYRGAAGCGPLNFTQINYRPWCRAPRINQPPCPDIPPSIYFGGTPLSSGPSILFGGTPSASGPQVLYGGNP